MGTFQYRPEWSGTTGGPGVSVFNARLSGAALATGPQQFADNVRVFFNTFVNHLPNEVRMTFPGEVTELDTVTGQLIAVHPITAPALVQGAGSTGYTHAAGMRVDWHTESILNGRRLRGRTFIVPVVAGVFDTSGRVQTSTLTTFTNAAQAYVDGMENIGSAAVWSRTHGILADVNRVGVASLGAVLRSRRD